MNVVRTGVLALAVVSAAPALAQEPTTAGDAGGRASAGGRLGIQATYGIGTELNGSVETDVATLAVRWTRPVRGARVLGGEPSWGVEVAAFGFDQEPRALGGGAHLLYEHRFAPGAPLRPVLALGAGALLTNERVPAGETHYNFSLLAGLLLEAELSGGTRLQVGYRLHHVSNADTGTRNLGINAHSVVLGFSWGSGR